MKVNNAVSGGGPGGVCTEPRHVAEAVVSRDDELVVVTHLRSQEKKARGGAGEALNAKCLFYLFYLLCMCVLFYTGDRRLCFPTQ